MTTTKTFGLKGWTPKQLGSLAGKTDVITGANAGAEFETTRILLSKGAKVIAWKWSVRSVRVCWNPTPTARPS